MKKKNLLISFVTIIAVISTAFVVSQSGKAGKTGSPGESTCASCHSNTALNAGPGNLVISSNIPGWKYTPGATYHITVTVNEASRKLFGFGTEILKSGNVNAGSLIITNSTQTQLSNSGGRMNVTHKSNGGVVTVAGTKAFTFDWKAPVTDSGNVTIYAAGIAGINDGNENNDNPYSSTQVVLPASTVGIDEVASAIKVSVFPNPVKDELTILFYNNGSGKMKADLYSIAGQKVATLFDENIAIGPVEKHFAVSEKWVKGSYLLNLNQNGKSYSQRILIQ